MSLRTEFITFPAFPSRALILVDAGMVYARATTEIFASWLRCARGWPSLACGCVFMGYKRELLRDKVGRLTQWHSWAPMEVNLAGGNECVAFLCEFFFFSRLVVVLRLCHRAKKFLRFKSLFSFCFFLLDLASGAVVNIG